MKRFILLLFFLFVGHFIYAMYPPVPQKLDKKQCIDTTFVELIYSFKFKNSIKQKEFTEDIRKVQIGRRFIKDYSQIVFYYDSLATERSKRGLQTQNSPKQTYPCEIYSDLEKHSRMEKYRMILNAGVLEYESQYKDLEWQFISNDTQQISNYLCNKAQVNFAGRNYTVWYTSDIPLPYGPYKFYGLPGLIIKVEEETGLFVWELYQMKKVSFPINLYSYEREQNCTEKEAKRTIKRMMSSPMLFLQTMGAKIMVKGSSGTFSKPKQNQHMENQYQPIELEN